MTISLNKNLILNNKKMFIENMKIEGDKIRFI